MRIAIISTPRSGNTWLRALLRDSLNLTEVAVHNYLEPVLIPDRCVFQLHWYREPNFQKFLSDHQFRVVTLARHPLDVLISVLHFVRYEPTTAKWLGGNCELPSSLVGQTPASDAFRDYALSFGCENLLSVSYQWWHDHSAIRVRYEDMVADPTREIGQLAEEVGVSVEGLPGALEANSLEVFRSVPNRHGWQGRPGLWRELIPYETAALIHERHHRVFETLGYNIAETCLTREVAEANWANLLS